MSANNNYSESHLNAKNEFVRRALAEFEPRKVLDVGCNTGHYSAMAAGQGASVTSIDYDPVVVGETWRRARAERLDVLPLVVNLTRPTPSTGWRNAECPSFLDRARGSFDAVLMLAVLHHMLVSERVPLPEIIDLASELTTDLLILEFVSPEDSMFRRLTRGRDHLFAGLSPEVFEGACGRKFEIVRSQHLENTSRWLYLLRKR
jgi:SAM-dependent methyltransferase